MKFLRRLASLRPTLFLAGILIPATIAGTLILQGRPLLEYVHQFGVTGFRIIHFFWLDEVFASFWFWALLILLGLNLTACLIVYAAERYRSVGFYLVHVGFLLILAGGFISAVGRFHGRVRMEEGQSTSTVPIKGKKRPLGFDMRLLDFDVSNDPSSRNSLIVTLPSGERQTFLIQPNVWQKIPDTPYQFRVEQYVDDFRLDTSGGQVVSASDKPRNPAVYVHLEGPGGQDYGKWIFYRFQETGHATAWLPIEFEYVWAPIVPRELRSRLALEDADGYTKRVTIEVNKPLRYHGFSVFQSDYDHWAGRWVIFEIVRDPGAEAVFGGMILLMMGLILDIYLLPFMGRLYKLQNV